MSEEIPKVEKYKKRIDKVNKFSDPKMITDHMDKHLGTYPNHLPETSMGLSKTVMSAQQFLQSKMPQPINPLPLSATHKPSKSDMSKFNHYYEIVSDPLSVIDHVKNGTLRKEHMESMQSVYPNLLGELQQKVMEHMDFDKAHKLPFERKQSLAKFMGQPMDRNMTPETLIANQQALVGSRAQKNAQKVSMVGMRNLKSNERTSTESQTLEEQKD